MLDFSLKNSLRRVITARKRSLRRLCFYTCLSVHWGGVLSGPGPGGGWGVWPGGMSRSMPRFEVGGLAGGVQAHTQGGWMSRPTPRGSRGNGGVSRPRPGECIPACTEADTPPADGYFCGWYASYWNAFLSEPATSWCYYGPNKSQPTKGIFKLTSKFMIQWFIRIPEFAEFTEFPFQLEKNTVQYTYPTKQLSPPVNRSDRLIGVDCIHVDEFCCISMVLLFPASQVAKDVFSRTHATWCLSVAFDSTFINSNKFK